MIKKNGIYPRLWTNNFNIMKTQNHYVDTYRRESYILEFNRNRTHLNPAVIPGNPDNLNSHLLKLRGNENGIYFDSHHREVPSTISILKEQEQKLEIEWKQHIESRINLGEKPPTKWPTHLQDKKERLAAKMLVAAEEMKWLEEQLDKAEQDKKAREKKPANSRLSGAGRLRDGILVEFCGWNVSKNDEGILCIDDSSSLFNSMPVWRLKSAVLNIVSAEYVLRHKKEETAAVAEGRPKKAVKYPVTPTWNKANDLIEYPGDYDPSIIRKLKLSVT